ncbi:hypothetical protein TSUD_346930 [Trifolium subterraneum]|nr:hypothetical protein TSUD_346930 [Trifolium subterraneum]
MIRTNVSSGNHAARTDVCGGDHAGNHRIYIDGIVISAVNERDLMKAVLKRPISGDIFDKIECHVPDPILKNTFKLEKKPNHDVVLVGYGTREGNPPPVGWVRLNMDGYCRDGGYIGCGGIIRGSDEEWLGGLGGFSKYICIGNA